jgi:superfamily II DNA or RNA helicase
MMTSEQRLADPSFEPCLTIILKPFQLNDTELRSLIIEISKWLINDSHYMEIEKFIAPAKEIIETLKKKNLHEFLVPLLKKRCSHYEWIYVLSALKKTFTEDLSKKYSHQMLRSKSGILQYAIITALQKLNALDSVNLECALAAYDNSDNSHQVAITPVYKMIHYCFLRRDIAFKQQPDCSKEFQLLLFNQILALKKEAATNLVKIICTHPVNDRTIPFFQDVVKKNSLSWFLKYHLIAASPNCGDASPSNEDNFFTMIESIIFTNNRYNLSYVEIMTHLDAIVNTKQVTTRAGLIEAFSTLVLPAAIPAKYEDNQLNNIENNENSLQRTDFQFIDNIGKNHSSGIAVLPASSNNRLHQEHVELLQEKDDDRLLERNAGDLLPEHSKQKSKRRRRSADETIATYETNESGEIVLKQSLPPSDIDSIPENATVVFNNHIDSETLFALERKGCSLIHTGLTAPIDSKYQEGKACEVPTWDKNAPFFSQAIYYSIKHANVNDVLKSRDSRNQRLVKLNNFIGFKTIRENDRFIFIMAGRNQNAFTPSPLQEHYRTVLVLTNTEYEQLKGNRSSLYPYEVLLVNRRITTTTDSIPSMITARRRATLEFSLSFDLNHFLMLDDNIETVYINQKFNALHNAPYANIYDMMHKETTDANEPLASLQTKSYKRWHIKTMLGCKYFFFNLDIIRSMLTALDNDINPKDIGFSIFPEDDATGQQDYYMQLYFHCLAGLTNNQNTNRRGFYSLPKTTAQIDRSPLNLNLAQSNNKPLSKIIGLTIPFAEQLVDVGLSELVYRTTFMYNSIISEGIKQHSKRTEAFYRVDYTTQLLKKEGVDPVIKERPTTPLSLQEHVNIAANTTGLHPHQRKALLFYNENLSSNNLDINFTICTGGGKTYIQGLIAFAHFKAHPEKNVVIVCPTQLISTQFRETLRKLAQQDWLPRELAVDPDKIHTVLSDTTTASISQDHFHWNASLQTHANILVVCHDSFKKLIHLDGIDSYNKPFELVSNTSVFLFDEAHLTSSYDESTIQRKEALPASIRRLNFTATAIYEVPLSYEFDTNSGVESGILAPFVVDNTFPEQNIKNWNTIQSLILNHPMPKTAGTLKDYKGIIYVSSIADANALFHCLQNQNYMCYRIDSKNSNGHEHLLRFKQETKGIAIAVDMLVEGFDCPDVYWAMILKSSLSGCKEQNKAIPDAYKREQMLGRLLRKFAPDANKQALLIVPDNFRLSALENKFSYINCSNQASITPVTDTIASMTSTPNNNNSWGETEPRPSLSPSYAHSREFPNGCDNTHNSGLFSHKRPRAEETCVNHKKPSHLSVYRRFGN